MFIFLLDERLEVHHGVELLRCIAQQRLEITDKPVDVPTKYVLTLESGLSSVHS